MQYKKSLKYVAAVAFLATATSVMAHEPKPVVVIKPSLECRVHDCRIRNNQFYERLHELKKYHVNNPKDDVRYHNLVDSLIRDGPYICNHPYSIMIPPKMPPLHPPVVHIHPKPKGKRIHQPKSGPKHPPKPHVVPPKPEPQHPHGPHKHR